MENKTILLSKKGGVWFAVVDGDYEASDWMGGATPNEAVEKAVNFHQSLTPNKQD